MSVALSQRQSGKGRSEQTLPWVGMGLCLAIFFSYLAYDRSARKPRSGGAQVTAADRPADTSRCCGGPSPASATTVTLDGLQV